MWYKCRIRIPAATFSGDPDNITILDKGNPILQVPDRDTFHEEMEFLYEVNKSSAHPKELKISIKAEGCKNTVETQPTVTMKTRALEIPKITLDPLEREDFLKQVIY